MASERFLILGGAGFLGAHLARRCLQDEQARVAVLDSLESRLHATAEHLRPLRERVEFIQARIGDEKALTQALRGRTVVFNCAAQTSHPLSMQDPLYDAELNCLEVLRLLETARRENPQATYAFAGSSTAVGKAVRPVMDEDHPEDPLDLYSVHKLAAEKYHRVYHRAHGLKTVVLRFANLYGAWGKGAPEFGFINYFIHLARTSQPITLYGDGAQQRNVMHASDAAEAFLQASRCPALLGGVYFAGSEEHLTVAEIARGIVQVFGGRIEQVPWPDDRRKIDVASVTISSARLRALIPWTPKLSFLSGLQLTKDTQIV